MKRILVTGAGGFAGRNLAEHLGGRKDLCRVFAARHADLDLLDEKAVGKYLGANEIDLVLHCATVGGTRKTGYDAGAVDVAAVNIRMFLNLARCLNPGMRMINLGSGAEYDHRAYTPRMKEDAFDASVPADPYGFSKYAISKYIEKAENITCLRIFGMYGKYEDYTFKFISNAIVKNLLGLPIVINQNVRFDYLYINDFVRLVEAFIGARPRSRHYNVTPSESADLVSLAGLINKVADKPVEVRVLNQGLNREYTGDNSRLLAEFPGFEFTSYERGIKELYSYYKSRLSELDLDKVKQDPYLKNCRTI